MKCRLIVNARPGHWKGAFLSAVAFAQEKLGIFDQVRPERGQVLLDRLDATELLQDVLQGIVNCLLCHFGVQEGHGGAMFLFQPRDRLEVFLKILFGKVDRHFDLLAVVVRKIGKVVGLDHLAVSYTRDCKPHWGAQDRHIAANRSFLKLLECLLLAGGKLLLERASAVLVLLRLEERGDIGAKVIDQRFHGLLQRPCSAGRHCDGLGPLGIVEVVHIDPVRRDRSIFRFRLKQSLHCGVPACTNGAHCKQIEIGM